MKSYTIRPYNRKSYGNVTVQFLLQELEQITAQAVKHQLPRHTLLTRAIKVGLPQVLSQLEARQARSQAQDKE